MKPITVALAATLLWLPTICHGRELADATQDARETLAGELSRCAAYYELTAAEIEGTNFPGQARNQGVAQAKQVSKVAMDMAAQLSSQTVVAARMDFDRQMMQREINNDWRNFSPIAARYTVPCKDIVERPEQRFGYLVNEMLKRPDVPPAKPK